MYRGKKKYENNRFLIRSNTIKETVEQHLYNRKVNTCQPRILYQEKNLSKIQPNEV